MAQPQVRRNTWDGPPGRSVVDARATELLHVYIYDYCKKHNFVQAARSFAAEANISTEQQPPIDIATGFLADWWGVFWDVYNAKNKDAQATKEAGVHDEYHDLLRSRKEEVLQQQRNFSMQQAVQQQQQRRASEVQRMAQSPQLQHPLHGQQQDPQQQLQAQQHSTQPPHVPSQQQQQQQPQQHQPQQHQPGQSRDHRPSPASSTASLPTNGGIPPPNNSSPTGNINTPQSMPASLPQQQLQQQHPAGRMGAPSPSFSPQQMQRPGGNNAVGNESIPGHPDGMMNSPMVSAQGMPMNAQQQMMMNQRPPNMGPPSAALLASSMNAVGLGGRDPQTLSQEERNMVHAHIRRLHFSQAGMMRNPNMMGFNNPAQAQARLQMQQQVLMNQQMYQQQQQQQHQQQMQQGQPQTHQQQPQSQPQQQQQHQPGQPPIPSQQGPGTQLNPQAMANSQSQLQVVNQQQQQQQPNQPGQSGQHPAANNQPGNLPRPPGNMGPGGTPTAAGPGQQMAANMQNPSMVAGQFGGTGDHMNIMLAQQMVKNGQMAGLSPQQQQQQQQQFLAQQQQQRLLFNQRRMMQQQQQQQGGQTPPNNTNMANINPQSPMNPAGSPQDQEKNRGLALYQRRQVHYIMQQQQHDQQRQQFGQQQQQGQTPPQQQQQQTQHPSKRQRPNPDTDNPSGGGSSQDVNQSPQMAMGSPHVINAAQTPQNTNNLPGSAQASPVMTMQQRLSQQPQQPQQQSSPFIQDAKPSQSPQMNRNINKSQLPQQQTPQQLPQQGMPPGTTRMGWNQPTQGGDMQSPGMIEGDQSPAVQAAATSAQVETPGGGGGMVTNNNGTSNSNNMISFDLERFMMSDGGDFGEIFTAGDDGGDPNLLMGSDNNEMFGGGFLASMGGGFGGDTNASLGGVDNATSLSLVSELVGHTNKVSTVAFSPDGQWLASAGHDKKVLIWGTQEKRVRWTLEGHTSQITCARWSPDQRNLLLTSSYDKTLRVWDLGQVIKDGQQNDVKQIAKFDCKAPITAVDFAPDRPDTVCSLDAEGELNVWHISSSKSEKTMKMSASKSLFATNPLRFHPRLGKILACAAGNQLFVINIDAAKSNSSSTDTAAVRTINVENAKNISSLDWSIDGNYLVASSESAVIIYETGHWKMINMYAPTDKIGACAFVMPTSGHGGAAAVAAGSDDGGDSSGNQGNGGVAGAEKLRVVYGSYESIYVWQCSVQGSQPKRAGGQSGMVAGLACINNNGQTIVASASHNKEKNLMMWTL